MKNKDQLRKKFLALRKKRYFEASINKFNKLTDCPIIINTSFNIRGEPIVCSPEDALKCFMGTELDILVIENFYLKKSDQKELSNKNYKDLYELD